MNNQIVIRNAAQTAALLVIGADNSVLFGKGEKPNADELAGFAVDRANASASASLQAVNAVRLARCLPDIVSGGEPITEGEKKGQKTPVVKTPAMKYVLEKVREGCATASTYQNIMGLIECADICDYSGITASPFAVKESLGYLRKVGAIGDGASGAKLLMGKAGSVGKALKEGKGVNAMRPVVKAAKERKPDLFKSDSTAPAKVEDTADKVALDLKGIVARWDKLASAGKAKELRGAASETVAALAKLAGFSTAPLK